MPGQTTLRSMEMTLQMFFRRPETRLCRENQNYEFLRQSIFIIQYNAKEMRSFCNATRARGPLASRTAIRNGVRLTVFNNRIRLDEAVQNSNRLRTNAHTSKQRRRFHAISPLIRLHISVARVNAIPFTRVLTGALARPVAIVGAVRFDVASDGGSLDKVTQKFKRFRTNVRK